MDSMQKLGPKEVFLHLLTIVTLYASAISFLVLTFQYIELFIPDALEYGRYAKAAAEGSIRWSLAMLVVVFPTYIASVNILKKRYGGNAEFREMRIRKWLVYFTLFAASLVLIGDAVALIFRFLDGELTGRFILKVLSVFFVAGSILGYYAWDIREKKSDKGTAWMRYASFGIVGVVATAVVFGFFAAGSPSERRAERFDERRIQDLQYIQTQVENYWRAKNAIPDALYILNDDSRGVKISRDPETGKDYGYNKTGELTYSICAEFNLASKEDVAGQQPYSYDYFYGPMGPADWSHSGGYECFDRAIDPDFFEASKPIIGR